jgi:tight adherence protein B
MRRYLLAAIAAVVVVLAPSAAWAADDEPSIAHVEATDDGLRVLVSVPAGVDVDLTGVTGSLDGAELTATATSAGTDGIVQRTTILAIDTSNSMARNGRFEAAKAAALTFLDSVPDDVAVGIVTFDGAVSTALEPTTDRSSAEDVVTGLALSQGTMLYDGILAAVDLAGADGQRSIVVLSDGADTGDTALADVTAAIQETSTLVDVVSLDQTNKPKATAALSDLAEAGQGEVIESTGDALADAFAAEAEVLALQILVTAPLPDGFDAEEATVSITLPTPDGDLVASAFAKIQDAPDSDSGSTAQPVNPDDGWQAPSWALYAGIAVFGFGLLTAAMLLVPAKQQPMSIAERVTAYTAGGVATDTHQEKSASEPVVDQAKAAAAGVLQHHKGYEAKLSARLIAAGSDFKPSEWLLLHVGVVIAAGVFGLLLGAGNVIVGLLFVVIGFFLPRIFLSFLAGRRRKKFNTNLPDTLQLMSGALAAGLSLAQSVDTVVNEGPEPIASEFKRVLVEQRIGVPLEDAFDGVAERFASKDFAWVVMAIRIQRQVGGNLAELLTTVAGTMREREYLRRQVAALAAEGKLSAIVLAALPPLFLFFLSFTNRSYITPLFETGLGLIMLIGATLWLGVGIFWMSRMVKVEI